MNVGMNYINYIIFFINYLQYNPVDLSNDKLISKDFH